MSVFGGSHCGPAKKLSLGSLYPDDKQLPWARIRVTRRTTTTLLGERRQSFGPSRLLLSRLVVLSSLRTDLCRNIRDGAGRSDSRRSIVLCGKEWEVFQSRFLDAPTRALKRDGRGVEGNPQIGVLGA